MTIVHPAQPVNGLNPEDVFYAVDDLGTQTGYGFILYQYHPGLYPDCPVNLYFSIDSQRCLQWHEESKTADPVESEISPLEKSKQAQAAEILLFMLKSAPVKATDAQALFTGLDISRRTLLYVKKELGIRSARRDGIWYWYLPNAISFQEDN